MIKIIFLTISFSLTYIYASEKAPQMGYRRLALKPLEIISFSSGIQHSVQLQKKDHSIINFQAPPFIFTPYGIPLTDEARTIAAEWNTKLEKRKAVQQARNFFLVCLQFV